MRKKTQNEFGAVYLMLALLLGFFLGGIVVYWNFNRQHEKLFVQTYEKLLAVFSDTNVSDVPPPVIQPPTTSTPDGSNRNEQLSSENTLHIQDQASEYNTMLQSDTSLVIIDDTAADELPADSTDFTEENDDTLPVPATLRPAPGYTLARDRLLHSGSVIVPLSVKTPTAAEQKLDSLLGNRSQPQQQHYFYLEFWESPLNSLGYKMGKNKIVFYGIRQYDMVGISNHKGNFYLSYLNELYQLEFTNTFKPLVPLGGSLPTEEMIQEL